MKEIELYEKVMEVETNYLKEYYKLYTKVYKTLNIYNEKEIEHFSDIGRKIKDISSFTKKLKKEIEQKKKGENDDN